MNHLVALCAAAALSASIPAYAGAPKSQAAPPDDAEIAAIVVAANQIDIDTGKVAVKRSTNPKVREFAQRMIDDHTSVNQKAGALVAKLGVTPKESATSRGLRGDAQKARANLQKKSGAEFDRAYVDHEVAYHQAVIGAVDTVLLPNAKNAQLKDLIAQVRPALQAHLDHARQIQGELSGKATGGAGAAKHGSH